MRPALRAEDGSVTTHDRPSDDAERTPAVPGGSELSVRAEESIEAWEKKRAAERGADRSDDMSDDAESGGP